MEIIIIVLLTTILVCWTFSASVYVYAALQESLLNRAVRQAVNDAARQLMENLDHLDTFLDKEE